MAKKIGFRRFHLYATIRRKIEDGSMKFLIINGPNLNLLGTREPDVYGSSSLKDIEKATNDATKESQFQLVWEQSNHEGEIIDLIQGATSAGYHGIIINPAGYSHSSVAILDALKTLSIPKIEVHLSNAHNREPFRLNKLTAKASTIIMEGLGPDSYYIAALALERLIERTL